MTRYAKRPFKCYVMQWVIGGGAVGVYGSVEISVAKVYGATLLLDL